MRNIKILTSVAIMSVASIGFAQDGDTDSRDELKIGIKAGVNRSNVYDERADEFEADAKLGFVGGAFLHIPIGKFLGVQPEVLYSQKGFKAEGRFLGSDYNFKRTTTYIDIPLLIAFKPIELLTIVAGPQYSYLMEQKDVFSNSTFSTSEEKEFENDNLRRNTFGFAAGVDINIDHFVIGARMCWDITDNHGDGSSSSPRYKNMWLQGTVGYAFF